MALARLAGLTVHYQLAEVEQPTWNAHTGLLIRNNHVNVLVEGARFDRSRAAGHTVDFNEVDPQVDARVRKITDAHAESLFYANLSVENLLAGQERLGFAYLRRGLETAPGNADLWINLGAFYSRHGAHEEALASYAIARQLKPQEKLVLSGLERSHRALGNVVEADLLAREVQRYRQRNPHYHFALAQSAYEAGQFSHALASIRTAQRLKRRVSAFHYMESVVLQALDDEAGAARSLGKARRYHNGRRGGYDDKVVGALVMRYGKADFGASDPSDI